MPARCTFEKRKLYDQEEKGEFLVLTGRNAPS